MAQSLERVNFNEMQMRARKLRWKHTKWKKTRPAIVFCSPKESHEWRTTMLVNWLQYLMQMLNWWKSLEPLDHRRAENTFWSSLKHANKIRRTSTQAGVQAKSTFSVQHVCNFELLFVPNASFSIEWDGVTKEKKYDWNMFKIKLSRRNSIKF